MSFSEVKDRILEKHFGSHVFRAATERVGVGARVEDWFGQAKIGYFDVSLGVDE